MVRQYCALGSLARWAFLLERFSFNLAHTQRGEEIGALCWRELIDQCADPVPQGIARPFCGFTEMGLEFGEGLLDWIEVRAVGRQILHSGTCGFDRGLDAGAFVCAEIIHDDDVAGSQIGYKDAINIGLEAATVDRTIKHHGRYDASQP